MFFIKTFDGGFPNRKHCGIGQHDTEADDWAEVTSPRERVAIGGAGQGRLITVIRLRGGPHETSVG